MGIYLANKKECTGCEACANVCPKGCIKMAEDTTGFVYPTIDKDKCINCKACVNACPVINKTNCSNQKKPVAYGAKCKDDEIRFKSTSGGLFATIARGILTDGGIVVGAIYETPFYVKHAIAYHLSQLEPLLQSKYVQSRIKYIYRQVAENLKTGQKVLFAGTPCQVAGLYSFLNARPENLVTCDFICFGINSPKSYREWLKEYEKMYCKIEKVWFKYKVNGWYNSPMCTRIDFDDKTNLILDKDDNKYMAGYIYDALYIRPCCERCKFKGLPRIADITLGDFWGINADLDDNKGTSVMILNNDKAKKIFENVKTDLIYWKANLDDIVKGNHMIKDCVNINNKSLEFLNRLGDIPFSALYEEYSTNNENNIKW